MKKSEVVRAASRNPATESVLLLAISGTGLVTILQVYERLGPITGIEDYILRRLFLSVGFWVLTVVPVALLGLLGSYNWKHFGVTLKSVSSALLLLLCFALAMSVSLIGTWIREGSGIPFGQVIVGTVIQGALNLVFIAFPEELLFRGAFQNRFIDWTNSNRKGIILAAVAFALYHVPRNLVSTMFGGTPLLVLLGSVSVYTPVGVAFGIMALRSGTLKWSIACHTLFNTGGTILEGLLIAMYLLG